MYILRHNYVFSFSLHTHPPHHREYLIGYYTLQQFQTSSFMEGMQTANTRTIARNSDKEFLAAYIHTPAYQSQVAKATQNRKLPGEAVINIIRGDAVE
jgi:hypothetical protein